MWSRLRGRRPFVEVSDGRERIVLERRHSHDGSHHPRRQASQGDGEDRNGRWYRTQYQHVVAANDGLRSDNNRLLRDNQALQQHLRDVTADRDNLVSQSRTRNIRANAMRALEEGLEAEQTARRRAERRLRDEKAAADRRERELLIQMRRLRDEEETWRSRAAALTREVRELVVSNRQKETRIRALEEWLRRQGVLPLR